MSVKKSRKLSGFVIYSYFKDIALTTIKKATVPKKEVLIVLPYLGLHSVRSRRLEVVGTRKNGRARRGHARGEAHPSRVSLARPFSLSPSTSKLLLRSLGLQSKIITKQLKTCINKF